MCSIPRRFRFRIDSPSGFWGEYQVYRKRTVRANGVPVVQETMDLAQFTQKYFRFADVEDSIQENTFDKYQRPYFQEKQFDAEVKDGQLYLEFEGEIWANYVSALVIYPASEAALGAKYLANLQERRRFYFDNYFKRILPDGRHDALGTIPEFVPTATETAQGYALFQRDWMQDVPVNAVPRREETGGPVELFTNAGKQEYGMKFRLDWFWNAAGDPYYALDCREDDYAWVVTNANRDLIPTLHFEREIREGIDDYRYMLTLARLIREHPTHPAAAEARRLLEDKLGGFKLGDREHDSKWPSKEYRTYRLKLAEAIELFSM